MVSVERLQENVQKRPALDDGCKKKNAIAKKKNLLGLSIGAPAIVARVSTPRVTFVAPRDSIHSNEEVEIVATPTTAIMTQTAYLGIPAPTVPASASGKALASSGMGMTPSTSSAPRGSRSSLTQEVLKHPRPQEKLRLYEGPPGTTLLSLESKLMMDGFTRSSLARRTQRCMTF